MQLQEVIAAGPGWTRVKGADGLVYTVEGARNWRNHNPGNIEYGDFAVSQGAIGTDGRFAVFPTYDAGRSAKAALIFDGANYRDLSLQDAIYRYAPPSENDSAAYASTVAQAAGVDPDTVMSQIPSTARAAILDAMQEVEGWKPGQIIGENGEAVAMAERKKVTDPAILELLNGNGAPSSRTKVTDTALLQQLNGPSEEYNAALEDASARSKFLGGPVTPRVDAGPAPVDENGEEIPLALPGTETSTNLVDASALSATTPNLADSTMATMGGFINGIFVAGPALQKGTDYLASQAIGLATGEDAGEVMSGIEDRRAARAEANPIADIAGNVAGALATYNSLGATATGANALGLTGGLGQRVLAGATSNALIGAGDSLVRGQDTNLGAAVGGALGGAIPLGGAAIKLGAISLGRALGPTFNALTRPLAEAERRVGMAVERDATANPGLMLTQGDEVAANQNALGLINIDRGGETTRALGRSVANQSPEARAVIENTASDRFATQAARATETIKRVAGGNVDDLGYQQAIRKAAQTANAPRYAAAYNAPKAQAVFTPELQELMQAPAIQKAAGQVMTRSANRAAVEGIVPLKDIPFRIGSDGKFRLVQNADGTMAMPSLQFWDQVKRNLDGMIDTATSPTNPNRELAADLMALRNKLVGSLDQAVPEYQIARRGAAAFFGAEDALEAGKKFATTNRLVPEAKVAFAKFTDAEKEAFRVGYASELIDKIMSVGDRANVITQVFKSPASREMMELVFGPKGFKELEAYVRVEDIADRLRGAMGNSTTARQLVELGIGAGSGALFTGGDWKGALTGAAAAKGARYLGQAIDDKVMREVARLLLSDDPALIQQAVTRATTTPGYMAALQHLSDALALPTKAVGMTMIGEER